MPRTHNRPPPRNPGRPAQQCATPPKHRHPDLSSRSVRYAKGYPSTSRRSPGGLRTGRLSQTAVVTISSRRCAENRFHPLLQTQEVFVRVRPGPSGLQGRREALHVDLSHSNEQFHDHPRAVAVSKNRRQQISDIVSNSRSHGCPPGKARRRPCEDQPQSRRCAV